MFSTIRGRLWLSYSALIIVALAIVSAVLAVFLIRNPYIYRQTNTRLVAAQTLLLRAPYSADRAALLAQALDVRVLLLSADYSLLSDSAPDEASLGHAISAQSKRASGVLRDDSGRAWLYTAARLPTGQILVVAAPRPRLLPTLAVLRDELWRPIVEGGLVALLFALLLAYLLAGWIGDPLQRLMEIARDVESRDPHGRGGTGDMIPPTDRGPKEVRELTRAFSDMLERVGDSQRSQKEFVANVSHELKTPLTAIQGFSQAILDGTANDAEALHQAAQVINQEAGRMHRMATDLLELARLDAGIADMGFAPVDIGAVLSGVQHRLLPSARTAGISIDISVGNPLPAVWGDGDRLATVFANLIDNAVKFTPTGGRVAVVADGNDGGVTIRIRDSGPGIAAKDLPHVFDRFYQADSSRGRARGQGAGLGLAIAREITEAHGGRISVRSDLGHGAEFTVHLPTRDGRKAGRGAA